MNLRRPTTAAVAALLPVLLVPLAAQAQAYTQASDNGPTGGPPGGLSLSAIGTETGMSSSNPLLSVGPTKSIIGSTTTPEFIINDATPTSLLKLDNRIDVNSFNQTSYNSTDLHTAAGYTWTGQNWSIGSQQHVDYDTTRTSEQSNYGLNVSDVRHTGLSASPQITYSPTAADQFTLAGSVSKSTYASTAFTDYATYSLSPSYTRRLDPLNAASLTLQAQRYETLDNLAEHIDTVGPMIGWTTTLSPRLSGNIAVGAQTSRSFVAGQAATSWAWQYVFSGGLTFKGIQDSAALTTNRVQSPYGNGTEALQTSVDLTDSHALNDRFSLDVDANYTTSSYQINTPGSVQNMIGGTGGATFHATKRIDLEASYQYRYETLTSNAGTARDNRVMLNFIYHPNIWTVSH